MAKHKSRKEWVNLFREYEETGLVPDAFIDALQLHDPAKSRARRKRERGKQFKIRVASRRFLFKYKQ